VGSFAFLLTSGESRMPDRRSYLRLATAANVADINMLGELLHGDEESLHADTAYHSKALKADAEASGIKFNVNQRGSKHRKLTKAQRARNRRLSRIRATVEHSFLVVKRLWGHGKVVGGVRMAPCQEPDEFREARRRLCRCCSSFLRRSRAYPI
jgi:IS5 family transposase